MVKSSRNEIINCRQSCCRPTDRFVYCIILNATDELRSMLNYNCMLKIHTFFNDIGDLMRQAQSKQAEAIMKIAKNVEMLCELSEKISTRNSSSQTEGEVISVDTRAPDRIKRETANSITFVHKMRLAAILNQIYCENFPRVVTDFAHLRLLLLRAYTENAILDNAGVSELCGCAPKSIGTGTQSNIVSREFSSETSLDAPTKACGKKRRADFIPEEIAKVSDTLTAEARRACDVAGEKTVLYARKLVILMTDRTVEETFRSEESLISPVIGTEEKSDIAAATDVAMQRDFFKKKRQMEEELAIDKDVCVRKTAFNVTDSAEELITCRKPAYPAEKTLEEHKYNTINTVKKIPLSKKTRSMKETEVKHSPAGESAPPTRDMFPESVQIKRKMPRHRETRTAEKTDEVETSPVGKPTQPARDMFPGSVSTYGMPRFKKTRTIRDTVVESSPTAEEEPTQLTKDTFRDSAQTKYKVSRFKKTRAIKDTGEDETSPAGEPTSSSANGVLRKSVPPVQTTHRAARMCSKRSQAAKAIESCSANAFASFTCSKPIRRSCDYFGRSTTEINQDCRQPKIHQSRCCARSRHCDTSRLSLRNEDPLHHVCYPFLQDPCVSRCRSGYWWGKTCDTNSREKYGATTVGNPLYTHAYCNGDTGHYCPHLNAIDNSDRGRTGHCHWNDGRSVWNDDRHY